MKTKPSAVNSKVIVSITANTVIIHDETVKTITFPTSKEAHKEFVRLTHSYRGCPRGTEKIHKSPQAVIYGKRVIIVPTKKRDE